MAINLAQVCAELNVLPNKPEDLEFVVGFHDQSIVLRRRVKLPMTVATCRQIEYGFHKVLARRALEYVSGYVPDFDTRVDLQDVQEDQKYRDRAAREGYGVGGVSSSSNGGWDKY